MYYEDCGESCAAEKRNRDVYGEKVTTWTRRVTCCNSLEVEAGTNGAQGGDWGHGNRVYLRLEDLAGTDWLCKVDGREIRGLAGDGMEVELILGGDSELYTVKEALRWMISVLEAQSE